MSARTCSDVREGTEDRSSHQSRRIRSSDSDVDIDFDRPETSHVVDEVGASAQEGDDFARAGASPATGHAMGFLNRMWKAQPVQVKVKSPASVRKKVAAGGGQHIREEDGWCGVVHRAEVMMCTIDQALDSNDKLRAASMNITQERIRGARRRSRRSPEPALAEQEPASYPAVDRPPPPSTTPKLSPLHRLRQQSPSPSTSSCEESECESDPGPGVASHKAFGVETPPKQRKQRVPGPTKSSHRKTSPVQNEETVVPAPSPSGAASDEQEWAEPEEPDVEEETDISLDCNVTPRTKPPPARSAPQSSDSPANPRRKNEKDTPAAAPVSPPPSLREPNTKPDAISHSPRYGPPRANDSGGCDSKRSELSPHKLQAETSSNLNAVPCESPANTPPARARPPVIPASPPLKAAESPVPPSRAWRREGLARTTPTHGARAVLVPRKVTSTAAQPRPKSKPKPEEQCALVAETTYVFDVAGGPSCKSAALRQTRESTSQRCWCVTDKHRRQGRLRDSLGEAGARDALTRGLRMCGPSRSRGFRTTTATTRSIQRSMDEPSPFGKVFSLPPLSPLDRSQFVLYSPKDMRHTTQKLSLNLPVVSTVRPAPIQRRFSS